MGKYSSIQVTGEFSEELDNTKIKTNDGLEIKSKIQKLEFLLNYYKNN